MLRVRFSLISVAHVRTRYERMSRRLEVFDCGQLLKEKVKS